MLTPAIRATCASPSGHGCGTTPRTGVWPRANIIRMVKRKSTPRTPRCVAENPFNFLGNPVGRGHAVDGPQQPPRPVIGQDRRGLFAIGLEARAHRLGLVV